MAANESSISSKLPVDNVSVDVFWLFKFSFMLYPLFGLTIATLVGQIVSLITGGAAQKIDQHLLIPFFQSEDFKKQVKRNNDAAKYTVIDQMLLEFTIKQSKSDGNDNEMENHDENDMIAMATDAKNRNQLKDCL